MISRSFSSKKKKEKQNYFQSQKLLLESLGSKAKKIVEKESKSKVHLKDFKNYQDHSTYQHKLNSQSRNEDALKVREKL